MAGCFFEAWGVDDAIVHDLRRTVTETDNLLISALTHNPLPLPLPLHLEAETAVPTPDGARLVT